MSATAAPVGRLVDQFEHGLDAPICLTWELTYACNLACVHCLSSSGRRDPRELSTAECKAVIDELQRMQVFYVNVGGGEPTVRRDFWELLDYATAHDVGVKFSTNGSRITPAIAARLAATDYVDVQISLDGASAEVNDRVRGPGSYDTALRAMHALADAGFRGLQDLGGHHARERGAARPVQGHRRRPRRAVADHASATLGPRGGRLGRTASHRAAAARALLVAARARRGGADRRLVLPPRRLRRSAAGTESVRGRPRGLPHRSHRRRVRVPVRDPRRIPRRQRSRGRRLRQRLARVRAVPRSTPTADGRSMLLVRVLRHVSRRLHGREVLHGPPPRRAGSGVRAGPRRTAPRRSGCGRAALAGRPLAPAAARSSVQRRSARGLLARKLMASSSDWFESVAEAQRRARKRLPKPVYDALVAGAERGATLDDNVRAFGELGFVPRIATGLPAARDQATTVLGQQISMPVIVSPTGVQAVQPERRGRRRARGGGGGDRHGSQLVREQADRGGRRGQPADVLPDVLAGHARAHGGDHGPCPGRRCEGAHRHARLDVRAPPRLGQPARSPNGSTCARWRRFAPHAIVRPRWLLDYLRSGGASEPHDAQPRAARRGRSDVLRRLRRVDPDPAALVVGHRLAARAVGAARSS